MKKDADVESLNRENKTSCEIRDSRKNKAISNVISLGVAAAVVALFVFFLARPFVESAADATFPRWALFLTPIADADFLNVVWFGVDLPNEPYLGERGAAFALGVFALLAAFGLGRAAFNTLKRWIPSFKTTVCETVFFSVGIGLVFFATALSWRSENGATFATTTLFALLTFWDILRKKKGVSSNDRRFVAQRNAEQISGSLFSRFDNGLLIAQFLLTALFASFYLFAATQPISEYDALEYHTQAAREIYEMNPLGSFYFSTTNVYADMPLGAETFYLWGFQLAESVGYSPENVLRIGVLAGKTILASVALLTALGIFSFAVRFLRNFRAGLFAALFYLSFPNVFDVFYNGLNDGVLGFAFFAAFYATFLVFSATSRNERNVFAGILGLFAGFAGSIKYTGVVFVALPSFFALFAATFADKIRGLNRFRRGVSETLKRESFSKKSSFFVERFAPILIFVAASALASGSWLIRNFEATGNPVYPLAFNVFGDSSGTWNSDVDARWRRAHSASDRSFGALVDSTSRPVWRDDLASPFFLFVPIIGIIAVCVAFLRRENYAKTSRVFAIVFGTIFVFWLGWHFATHRLTRFLVPVEPLFAVLLGDAVAFVLQRNDGSKSFVFNRLAKWSVLAVFAFGLCWCGLEIDLRGQGRLASLRSLERDPARFPAASIYFNDNLHLFADSEPASLPKSGGLPTTRPTKKLLLIGEAKAFAYRVPVLYSTCWNRSPIIRLLDGAVKRDAAGKIVSIVDGEKVRDKFRAEKIAFVLVDFAELARFRSPGNYGFTDIDVDENLFRLLEQSGVLERFCPDELRDGPDSTVIFSVR